jgi:hypothetical protein
MASLIYNSCLNDLAIGNIDFDSNSFKAMLVTSTYVPNKDTHTKRSDITNEVAGTGYSPGGASSLVTVALSTANDRVVITFGALSFTNSTLTARGCVYYRVRGGAPSADELVAYNDFGGNISSSGGTFAVATSTITLQN